MHVVPEVRWLLPVRTVTPGLVSGQLALRPYQLAPSVLQKYKAARQAPQRRQ